jgi:membrane protease YdiL (CAAX protease family)
MDDTARAQILAFDETQPVPAETARTFPSFWISFAWIAMYMAFQLLFAILVLGFVFVQDQSVMKRILASGSDSQFINQYALPLFVSVLLAGVATLAILFLNLRPQQRHEQIGLFSPSRLSTGLTICLGAALILATYLITWLYTTYVVPGEEMQAGVNQLIKSVPKTPLNHVLLFTTIAVVAPMLEELLFRGYLQSSLMRHMKPWVAIAVASAVFGAIHMQPLAFPMLMMLGAAFGYLYYRTGSLKTNIILHMLNNGAAYVMMVAGVSGGA